MVTSFGELGFWGLQSSWSCTLILEFLVAGLFSGMPSPLRTCPLHAWTCCALRWLGYSTAFKYLVELCPMECVIVVLSPPILGPMCFHSF